MVSKWTPNYPRHHATEFNRAVAAVFLQMSELLRQQQANPFRINAYVRAANTLETLDTDVRKILRAEGLSGLVQLPGIGKGLASAIEEIAHQGSLSQLERLRGTLQPELLFQTVPGVGPLLAQRIHDGLHVDTLEALESAAHDGRLETVQGIGRRRSSAIRAGLTSMLGRSLRRYQVGSANPPIAMLLDVDREYRERASAGRLPLLAPRRFNPQEKAWLPILHTDRENWHFTALHSNTGLAHRLGRTHDWVVMYFYDSDHQEGQHTIVTETRGRLKGQRVVRGREQQCGDYYDSMQQA
jgi:hypothetical protein